MFPTVRMRRLRQSGALRALVRETELSVKDLVLPVFVREGITESRAIETMPGWNQLPLAGIDREVDEASRLGIPALLLFGIPMAKDAIGSSSWDERGIVQQTIRRIKAYAPELLVIADNCLCEYTDHGHCGVVRGLQIDNDETLRLLTKQAVSFAQAGADMVAPSGMMDGAVGAIRQGLDEAGFAQIPIWGYTAKYASGLYAPFRVAAESTMQFGDRASYQMDPANGAEALREAALDLAEGADILMVKPATPYLDILYRMKQQFPAVPLGAYQVSGEFAQLKAAAERGWIDEERIVLETLYSIKRAGADLIITYYAKEAAKWLTQG